jgi:hypothetical protein
MTIRKKIPVTWVVPDNNRLLVGNFAAIEESIVDGEQWYKVIAILSVAKWIREQNSDMWQDCQTIHGNRLVNTVDIHSKLYSMMAIKFG